MHHKSKFTRVIIALGAISFLSPLGAAQTTEVQQQQVREARDQGKSMVAVDALLALRKSNPQAFDANNYDYLLARLQERTGKLADAEATYQGSVSRNSVLKEYSLWHLAQISRSTGDLVHERERLRMLLNIAPNSLLGAAAAMRLGQSFLESQDYKSAYAVFRQFSGSNNVVVVDRESQVLLGNALLKDGNITESREVFKRLLLQMPDAARPDDFALAAARALDALDAGDQSRKAGELPEADHLLRGSVYQFNRDFAAARLHYAAVVARFPQNPTVANALYQIGRGYYLQQKYEEALKYFQRVLKGFPESQSARDALSFSAGSYNRLKRTDDAIAAYKLFSEKYSDEPNPERPFLNIIDALHEAGRYKEALDWVQQTRVRFRTGIGGTLALFAQLRIHLAQGAWQAVIADANELTNAADLGGPGVAGGATKSEVMFLRAFALEQLGRHPEAIIDYLSITDGRNEYFGKRATQRLLALNTNVKAAPLIQAQAASFRSDAERLIAAGKIDEGRRAAQSALRLVTDQTAHDEILALVRRAYDSLPAYQLPHFKLLPVGRQMRSPAEIASASASASHKALADELLFLGLYDEAAPELIVAGKESNNLARASSSGSASNLARAGNFQRLPPTPPPNDGDYTIATYQLRGGHADQAVQFGERIWKNVPSDFVMELGRRDLVDLLYPLPFRDALSKHTPPRGVDPRFVISIARQESRFQPAAKSVAAARGLMQFIAETSNAMAADLRLQNFTQDDLYNPDTAILFGSQYLAGLFKQFPGQPQAVAASYNGGPENMARWLARSRSNDPDRYVSEIGFAQTKDYVFKVMLNYWQYQAFYDEKLERK